MLLNQRWDLNTDNYNDELIVFTSLIEYFSNWNTERKVLGGKIMMNASTTTKYFIADKTYKNMLRMIGGVFVYAKCILAYSDI